MKIGSMNANKITGKDVALNSFGVEKMVEKGIDGETSNKNLNTNLENNENIKEKFSFTFSNTLKNLGQNITNTFKDLKESFKGDKPFVLSKDSIIGENFMKVLENGKNIENFKPLREYEEIRAYSRTNFGESGYGFEIVGFQKNKENIKGTSLGIISFNDFINISKINDLKNNINLDNEIFKNKILSKFDFLKFGDEINETVGLGGINKDDMLKNEDIKQNTKLLNSFINKIYEEEFESKFSIKNSDFNKISISNDGDNIYMEINNNVDPQDKKSSPFLTKINIGNKGLPFSAILSGFINELKKDNNIELKEIDKEDEIDENKKIQNGKKTLMVLLNHI